MRRWPRPSAPARSTMRAATTLVFTLTNSGSNPAQSGITVGDTLPTGLAINSATPAVAYSAGCAGPATATYTAGTQSSVRHHGSQHDLGYRKLHGDGLGSDQPGDPGERELRGQPGGVHEPRGASVTTTGITNGSTDQCLVVNRANATVAKTFGAARSTMRRRRRSSSRSPTAAATRRSPGSRVGDTLPTGLRLNSATPAVAYSAGCAGPATATYTAGTAFCRASPA